MCLINNCCDAPLKIFTEVPESKVTHIFAAQCTESVYLIRITVVVCALTEIYKHVSVTTSCKLW